MLSKIKKFLLSLDLIGPKKEFLHQGIQFTYNFSYTNIIKTLKHLKLITNRTRKIQYFLRTFNNIRLIHINGIYLR